MTLQQYVSIMAPYYYPVNNPGCTPRGYSFCKLGPKLKHSLLLL